MDENRQIAAQVNSKTGPKGGIDAQMTSLVADLKTRLNQFDPAQRKWLGIAAALVIVSLAAILWYAGRTDWKTLYAGLDPEDSRAMASQLTTAGIPFEVSPDGTALSVSSEQMDKARLVTTAKGGPRSGRMGFDLFDKPNWIGSEFDEKVNYQRALEGELEHTIDTLSDVESSRVHLVMPHDSLFNEQQRDAKASVVLKLKRRTLSEEAGDSIRNLVASAVDDLRPENVVLLDTLGRPLGRKGGSAETEGHEQELAAKLIETLEPVVGAGNVKASVNVEYDTSTADEVDETYDPNDVVTLSMQRSEQVAGGQPVASGVPGTASNAPNTQPPVYPRSASESQSQKQESGTYGASKKVRHTTQGVGRLRRVTAAVLINQVLIKGKQPSWQARSPEQMKHLTELAQAAVGYDATRGDVVSVEDLPFDEQAVPEAPLGERLLRTASQSEPLLKYGTILLAIAGLLFFVVRPVMRRVQHAPGASVLTKPADALLASGSTETVPDPEKIVLDQQRLQAQSVFDSVTDHLRREPAQSTRLLQSWIHAE